MPYVNIPQSQLVGGIAKISGRMLGELSNKVVNKLNEVVTQFRREACPNPQVLKRLRAQKEGLERGISSVETRISKIKQLPNRIEAPVRGLEVAIRLIKNLPIPQAVPPGIGIPVSITTKYADLLHLLKELVAQAKENIEGIVAVTDTPGTYLTSLKRIISRIDGAIKGCEVEAALRSKVSDGSINLIQLQDIGLVDEDEVYIFSSLGPVFVGQASIDSNGNLIGDSNNLNSLEKQLQDILQKLQGSSIPLETKNELRGILNSFITTPENTDNDSRFFHTGPNGITYKLKVIVDENSPSIAPRRYAVAIDPSGVAVLKGQKSFSSSIDILLNEIKFRIDNQLS